MKTTKEVSDLINCLTNDEDLRQDLWVHYLGGNPLDSFESHLRNIESEQADEKDLRHVTYYLLNNPPSQAFYLLLTKFTAFEQSIMCLLALGFTISQISRYKSISEVRIRQAIVAIRYNKVWEEKQWLLKENYQTMNDTD